jgi:periplasmic protein TonB
MRSSLHPGVQPPVMIKKVAPEYTPEARNRGGHGKVILSMRIGSDGRPRNIKVRRPLEPGLDANAIAAMRQWRFKPATKYGQPVVFPATIELDFRLR